METENNKINACCFTGHRKMPENELEEVKDRLKKAILNSIEKGYNAFYNGGAVGFDTMTAQTILELKEQYPYIKLILALPCKSQADYWKQEDKDEYERIIKAADNVVWTSEKYTSDCMFKRNRYLVDHSSLCICYLTRQTGGTAYTVNYAKNKGIEIINIAETVSK